MLIAAASGSARFDAPPQFGHHFCMLTPLMVHWLVVICFTAALASVMMANSWAVQTFTRNTAWADVFWSYTVGFCGIFLALIPGPPLTGRQWLVAGLAALWSLRLGTHILRRTWGAKAEDPRYAHLRAHWLKRQPKLLQLKMFAFLQVQAVTIWLLMLPIAAAAHNPAPGLTVTDYLGAILLVLCIVGEGLADRQLKAFAARPENRGKNRVCETGLWAWSRHPNYTCEILGWVGYVLIGFSFRGYPWGWVTLLGPVLMFVLLRYLSGVTWLEDHMLRKYGKKYAAYQQRVGMFFTLPNKAR